MIYADQSHDKVPPIAQQTQWITGLFDFGKAQYACRYYNPSIIEHEGFDWLIARKSAGEEGNPWGKNTIWAFRLDTNHRPQIGIKLDFKGYGEQHWEDPRIIRASDGSMVVSYVTFLLELVVKEPMKHRWYGAHQQVAYLDNQFQPTRVIDPICWNNGGSVMMNPMHDNGDPKSEKNWLWFDHEGRLHTVYLTDPHRIINWNEHYTAVDQIYETDAPEESWWKYGHARGGTPPVRVGDEYWSFFHSSTPWVEWTSENKRRYHMGAYAFEAKPPFRITRFSRVPLLTGSPYDPWSPGQPLVVFPCGALLRNGKWLVTLGVNDMASAWIEIPHEDLVQQTPVYAKTQKETPAEQPAEVSSPAIPESSDNVGVEIEQGTCVVGVPDVSGPELPTTPAVPTGCKPSKGRARGRRIRRRRMPRLRSGDGVRSRDIQPADACGANA